MTTVPGGRGRGLRDLPADDSITSGPIGNRCLSALRCRADCCRDRGPGDTFRATHARVRSPRPRRCDVAWPNAESARRVTGEIDASRMQARDGGHLQHDSSAGALRYPHQHVVTGTPSTSRRCHRRADASAPRDFARKSTSARAAEPTLATRVAAGGSGRLTVRFASDFTAGAMPSVRPATVTSGCVREMEAVTPLRRASGTLHPRGGHRPDGETGVQLLKGAEAVLRRSGPRPTGGCIHRSAGQHFGGSSVHHPAGGSGDRGLDATSLPDIRTTRNRAAARSRSAGRDREGRSRPGTAAVVL